MGLTGAILTAASAGGLGWLWHTSPLTAAKREFLRVCRLGRIGLPINPKRIIYPSIKSISNQSDCIQIIFALPNGTDPTEVTKKLWLFRQFFGDNIELNEAHSAKIFELKIYDGRLQSFVYELTEIQRETKKHQLPIVVGRSRSGWELYDMVEHPGLLITGEPGSGKSTQLRAIITTLILTMGDRIDLWMADLKMTEFHIFKGVKSERMNAVELSDVRKMITRLNTELERRKRILAKHEVEHIDALPADERKKMNYCLVCIDEFGMLAGEDFDEVITLAQQGRALGMYLILSCQRADRQVMDGKIKLCLTVRMAFRASDETNSRITLDSGEAAQIQGAEKGKMAYKGVEPSIKFVQGPFLDVKKAKELLSGAVKKNDATTAASRGSTKNIPSSSEGSDRGDVLRGHQTERKDSGDERDIKTHDAGRGFESQPDDADVSILDLPISDTEKRWDSDKRWSDRE